MSYLYRITSGLIPRHPNPTSPPNQLINASDPTHVEGTSLLARTANIEDRCQGLSELECDGEQKKLITEIVETIDSKKIWKLPKGMQRELMVSLADLYSANKQWPKALHEYASFAASLDYVCLYPTDQYPFLNKMEAALHAVIGTHTAPKSHDFKGQPSNPNQDLKTAVGLHPEICKGMNATDCNVHLERLLMQARNTQHSKKLSPLERAKLQANMCELYEATGSAQQAFHCYAQFISWSNYYTLLNPDEQFHVLKKTLHTVNDVQREIWQSQLT